MTPLIAFGIGLSVGIFLTIVSLALCSAAGSKAPHPGEHSCNGGLTDEEMLLKKYDLLRCPKCGYVMSGKQWDALLYDLGCPVCKEPLVNFHEVKELTKEDK